MKPLLVCGMVCGIVCRITYTWAGTATAQTPDPAQAPDSAKTIQTLRRELAAQRHLLADWAGLTRYGSENTEVRPPAAGENRVVFLGDDITEQWGQAGRLAAGKPSARFFPGKPYLNRGISGQTTAQMLVRFRQDVILLKPKVVVILAGANDLAGMMGPATEGTMAENFTSMVELAKANGIRVVLASVTPVCDCFTNQTRLRPQGKIISLNGWIRDYAAKSGSVYLNYYAALAAGRDLKKELTSDGLLPNDAGYGVMAPMAEQAIAQALE
ncbi:MAG TPA: SGNH/GDSL hydrolase family protein [Candidatus Acidoferrales bacterium]|jgi:lysophospholipase L1-like esterase|nr:SGNH/GDSL hydrolase family protein [Candidatus Acidoferrales bacterium]